MIFATKSNGSYRAILYEGREYLPYCLVSGKERSTYLGYLEGDDMEEIYKYSGYSAREWLLNYLDAGSDKKALLYRERSVTEIPEGLKSEYEWNEFLPLS
jgi:hypothetical protein